MKISIISKLIGIWVGKDGEVKDVFTDGIDDGVVVATNDEGLFELLKIIFNGVSSIFIK